MTVKITKSIEQDRMVVSNDDRFGIQKYDTDNAYPQRLLDYIDGAGTLASCVDILGRFIYGNGFVDENLNKIIIDKKKTTLRKLLKFISKDYAIFNGYALHFNYNALYQISSISLLPFHYCRLGIENEETGEVEKIIIYNDWDKRTKKSIRKDDFIYYDVFNADPKIIEKQVTEAGGWDKWNGQILYYSEIINSYPKAKFHSRIKDAVTENESMTYRYASVKNGFSATHMLYYYGSFESDEERKDFAKNINANQGGENAGNIVLIDGIQKENKPDLEAVSNDTVDKRFELTEKTTSDNIRKTFLIPPVLIGDLIAGKLGTSQEIKDAITYFNGMTNEFRGNVSETLSGVMANFKNPVISNFEILKIQELN